jgi:hypothetical protein
MKITTKSIADKWLDYRRHCQSTSKTGYEIKTVDKNHEVYDLVINKWVTSIKAKINSEKYLIESSVGIGNLSAAPWLAIMDKSVTESAREGFYVVFLFSRSAKKLYLSLGLGATQFEIIYGRSNDCLDKIALAVKDFKLLFKEYIPNESLDKIDLIEDDEIFEEQLRGSSRFLVSAYEKGTCFAKAYDPKKLDDEIIYKDLNDFIEIYKSIVNDSRAENLDILAEKFAEKNNTANTDYSIPEFIPRHKSYKKNKISIVSKAKYKRRTQESKKIGLAGEDYVYLYEYEKLKKIGKENLAKKIIKHYENNEFPGWDITSYDENEKEIFIEVKSTKGEKINNLDITSNEWLSAVKEGDKYFIYLVNNVLNNKIKIFEKINNPSRLVNEGKIELSTSVYELKL